ncbi:unnamed protein product [Allacma fusca]|uniref:SWIM-type domain-containing protein n=1 Tax=Allacma fusca TaxID=39272 RepID=A0A8J2IX30_9HEXA|nr:unnamed protein product [Allacma fusca]
MEPMDTSPMKSNTPDTLLTLAAKYVGEKIPFQLIEERFNRIPEPVQKRVIYHSFPRFEKDIYMYSSFTHDSSSTLPFHKGVQIVESGGLVNNVLQIGFHLSGTVESLPVGENKDCLSSNTSNTKHRVSLSFDRCKITSCSCTCGSREIFWCEHIVALSIYRIRFASTVNLRVPISDQLLQLNRDQLQKLVQYIISDHQDVLPTAQNLTDQILNNNSDINSIQGAPDPTAGPSYNERHSWAFDEDQVKEQVRNYLAQGLYYNANKQLHNLFNKVREMLNARDSNAPRLLNLISYEFISDPRLLSSKSSATPMNEKHRNLWDQLINLWVCICMNPCLTDHERKFNKKLLVKYANHPNCPLEDGYDHGEDTHYDFTNTDPGSSSSAKRRRKCKPKSLFHRAIECLDTEWGFGKRSNIKLKDIPMECARVDALCSHGFKAQAIEVALSVLAHMKQFMMTTYDPKDKHNHHRSNYYGLLGHALDCHTPVFNVLLNSDNISQAFEFTLLTLGESRLMPLGLYSQEKATKAEESIINRLQEIELTQELISKLIETCHLLLKNNSGLGECIHPGSYPMQIFAKYLFTTLQPIDPELGYKIGLRAMRLSFLDEMDGNGPLFVRRAPRWYILGHIELQQCNLASTMLNSARYDFNKLNIILESCSLHVHSSSHLFRLAQDCLRIGGEVNNSCSVSCPNNAHWNSNQGGWPGPSNSSSSNWGASVASSSTSSSSGSHSTSHWGPPPGSSSNSSSSNWGSGAGTTSSSSTSNSSSSVASNWPAIPSSSTTWGASTSSSSNWTPSWNNGKNSGLINVGFKLGLQVLRQTLKSVHRRRWDMVRWAVTCACEVGIEGILYILRNWAELFTPSEAVSNVATVIMGGSGNSGSNPGTTSDNGRTAAFRSRLSILQQEEIAICARALARECARKDPPGCALAALTLCETEPIAFETAYQIVIDASSTCMTFQQLFGIARYMETRGYPLRAFKLALLALENIRINYNQDSHPAVQEIHWCTSLYYSLPHPPMGTQFIQLIVKNVQCANVLSEILRRCCTSNEKSPELNLLKESTMSAYISTVHARLTHISPRHYTDFIEFLSKAKDSFSIAGDSGQFQSLIESIKTSYKGKKKLVYLVTERFG